MTSERFPRDTEDRVLTAMREATEKSVEQYPTDTANPEVVQHLREGFVVGYMQAWTMAQLEKQENGL